MLDLKGRTEFFTSDDVIEGSNLHHYENQIMVISAKHIQEDFVPKYRTPENQLFFATGGFGLDPSKMGNAVFGTFLSDGERTRMERYHFIGILKPELVEEYNIQIPEGNQNG